MKQNTWEVSLIRISKEVGKVPFPRKWVKYPSQLNIPSKWYPIKPYPELAYEIYKINLETW